MSSFLEYVPGTSPLHRMNPVAKLAAVIAQALGLAVEAGFLFNIDTIYHWVFPSCIDFFFRAKPLRHG